MRSHFLLGSHQWHSHPGVWWRLKIVPWTGNRGCVAHKSGQLDVPRSLEGCFSELLHHPHCENIRTAREATLLACHPLTLSSIVAHSCALSKSVKLIGDNTLMLLNSAYYSIPGTGFCENVCSGSTLIHQMLRFTGTSMGGILHFIFVF